MIKNILSTGLTLMVLAFILFCIFVNIKNKRHLNNVNNSLLSLAQSQELEDYQSNLNSLMKHPNYTEFFLLQNRVDGSTVIKKHINVILGTSKETNQLKVAAQENAVLPDKLISNLANNWPDLRFFPNLILPNSSWINELKSFTFWNVSSFTKPDNSYYLQELPSLEIISPIKLWMQAHLLKGYWNENLLLHQEEYRNIVKILLKSNVLSFFKLGIELIKLENEFIDYIIRQYEADVKFKRQVFLNKVFDEEILSLIQTNESFLLKVLNYETLNNWEELMIKIHVDPFICHTFNQKYNNLQLHSDWLKDIFPKNNKIYMKVKSRVKTKCHFNMEDYFNQTKVYLHPLKPAKYRTYLPHFFRQAFFRSLITE